MWPVREVERETFGAEFSPRKGEITLPVLLSASQHTALYILRFFLHEHSRVGAASTINSGGVPNPR